MSGIHLRISFSSPTLPPSGYRSSAPPPASSPQPAGASSAAAATPTPLQRNAMNGSIEPIYENVPLPLPQRASGGSSGADAMRQRASSIQSAPPGVPPAPVPAARHNNNVVTLTVNAQPDDEITRNIKKYGADRAASTELQFLEPQAPQRTARAASAAPAIGATPPPRQHRSTASLNKSTVDVISPAGDSLHQQFSAMNLSGNTSASTSSMFNSTLDTTGSSSASKEVKRRRRWNILSRSKTPDKQKSATLGREKASTSVSSAAAQHAKLAAKMKLAQDDLNLPHRWSTGVAKPQPISGQYSKDKLVRNIYKNVLYACSIASLSLVVPDIKR